jgi:hypothetical protein
MKRTVTTLFLCTLLVAVALATVNFKQHKDPTFTDLGLTLSASGALSGLGNFDVTIILDADGFPTTVCKAPGGGNESPGQNPASFDIPAGTLTVSAADIKNGNLSFAVMTGTPAQPTAADANCPNPNWDAEIKDVTFTSATITVIQNGQVVLQQTFPL